MLATKHMIYPPLLLKWKLKIKLISLAQTLLLNPCLSQEFSVSQINEYEINQQHPTILNTYTTSITHIYNQLKSPDKDSSPYCCFWLSHLTGLEKEAQPPMVCTASASNYTARSPQRTSLISWPPVNWIMNGLSTGKRSEATPKDINTKRRQITKLKIVSHHIILNKWERHEQKKEHQLMLLFQSTCKKTETNSNW